LDEALEYKRVGLVIRARMRWALEGDVPSKYFFNLAKPIKPSQRIEQVYSMRDPILLLKDQGDITNTFLSYYLDLLGGDEGSWNEESWKEWCRVNPPSNKVDLKDLVAELDEEEDWTTISSIPNGKGPRDNGLLVDFYKTYWDNIKTNFMGLV